MQKFLLRDGTIKHIVGILLIFFSAMLEGGWDFDEEELNKAENTWESGNVVHTMFYSLIIFIIIFD